VIVVDDGSEDRTAVLAGAVDPRVKIIRTARQGVAAARNSGAHHARGSVLAFLDADDVWLPAKLSMQMALLDQEPELGLIHCGVEDINASGETIATHLEGMSGLVADELLLFRRPVILGGGSAAIFPRAVFESVGGFDERLSTSADWDLFYRVTRCHRTGFVPEVLVRYRLHESNMHKRVDVMAHDMLVALDKAFRERPNEPLLRRVTYGRVNTVLAGSAFRSRSPLLFLKHALLALLSDPRSAGYFLRYFQRRKAGGCAPLS
jgi:glycosyltransferase involved in cell wall biosynthesis